ncbi:unnamed protein product [Enterobius vermicularis]|uniref:Phospholipase A(2) n=1 Tax=Enterobius vermicularis TaxID=51028 RepID=A0A0N4VN03_ENTVE|nr:unnamed protein product [Enterobius vermicularis]
MFVKLSKNVLNQCCFWHDQCYMKRNGREYCDDNFCHCLRGSFRPLPDKLVNEICDLVKHFGEPAYEKTGKFSSFYFSSLHFF